MNIILPIVLLHLDLVDEITKHIIWVCAGDRYYSYQDQKEIKKVKLNSGNFKEAALHWSNEFLKFTVKALKQKST